MPVLYGLLQEYEHALQALSCTLFSRKAKQFIPLFQGNTLSIFTRFGACVPFLGNICTNNIALHRSQVASFSKLHFFGRMLSKADTNRC